MYVSRIHPEKILYPNREVEPMIFHQCGPCPILGPGVICGSVEFVVGSPPCSDEFPPSALVFLLPQKPTLPNSNRDSEGHSFVNRRLLRATLVNRVILFNFFYLRHLHSPPIPRLLEPYFAILGRLSFWKL